MRRVIPRLLVASCTFALGISAAALRHETRRPASRNFVRTASTRAQTCDPSLSLAADADTATAARLPLISSCELLRNPDCYDGRVVRVGSRIYWSEQEMFFDDSFCSEVSDKRADLQLHQARAEEVYGVMMKTCGEECAKPLDVVVIGRFEKLPASSVFEVKSFESVSRVR